MSQLMPPSLVTRVGPGGQGNMKVPDRGGLALRRNVEDRVPQSRFGCRTVPQKRVPWTHPQAKAGILLLGAPSWLV